MKLQEFVFFFFFWMVLSYGTCRKSRKPIHTDDIITDLRKYVVYGRHSDACRMNGRVRQLISCGLRTLLSQPLTEF